MPETMRFAVYPAPELAIRAAADLFTALAPQSIALAGGNTPKELYGLLASDDYRDRTDWHELEIYYGDDNYGGDCSVKEVKPLLERTDLKQLEYLGLKNAMFSDDIAHALAGAKVLKTVKTLDLSLGTLTDEGAKALVAAKDTLSHLEVLDLTRNFLSKDGVKLVKNLAKKVITDGQEEADDWGDGEMHYFVSISE